MGLLDLFNDFIEAGGPILYWVAIVLFVMWTMIFERVWYFSFVFPKEARLMVAEWDNRADTTSWQARKVREAWISQMSEKLNAGVGFIKTLVAICPMIGLLGTVTGMITVFELMALFGTGDPRDMASGITQATIPTMSGMVAALSGLFISTRLEFMAKVKAEQLADKMPQH
ncbi:MotA/TolQ/ExbB proton channel family protein [Pleionea mediterranea]|jgi:biopolymer transport protein ExbB|uniref:Outer membrane transport energization protein ExbB n=1 Tax=Pleionea mediterranea TaxID=523701 RepID=A0A316G0X5_9GAMM|nr:MotA/TolQ/ExbB proton channel family protein [Pleionea mediterranea]PWK54499.1 outer membrane transport energization protein ExbB [Pleionea mediterranea]